MNKAMINAQKFVNMVRESGILISKAVVFGSWAKGKANQDSDIDVCLVSSQFGKDYIKEMVTLRKIALKIDSRIEPIPLTPGDLNDPYGTLAAEIRKSNLFLN